MFCYIWGLLDHTEKNCAVRAMLGEAELRPYGSWLRAELEGPNLQGWRGRTFSHKTLLLNETHEKAKLPPRVAKTGVDAEEAVAINGTGNSVNAAKTVTVSENRNHETLDFASSTLKKILRVNEGIIWDGADVTHVQLPHDGKLNGEFAGASVSQLNTINSDGSFVGGSRGPNDGATPVEFDSVGPISVTKWKRRARDLATKKISSGASSFQVQGAHESSKRREKHGNMAQFIGSKKQNWSKVVPEKMTNS
ncbi:hypothetical protein Pyn_04786 [Prunus yedoensis var. nudiflora]|uniref:Uncharacterized protein n=1 Tax=Prunus yedoensis var. nudiflora TaxID=2094558 RepID=A0A314U938_PRUYE|nr:hypothetical protein Pyn_04786 [Prunus yedoensis var. nudiflora]